MKVSKDHFFSVGNSLKFSNDQLQIFWTTLEKNEVSPFSKYLFYFGALIVISAMTWFMTLGWETFGGGGIFLIAVAYALLFVLAGHLLWNKKEMRIPAGLCITIAVCMVPLAIYGLQNYLGFWPIDSEKYPGFYTWVEGRWIYMEIGTILAGLLALRFYPFPFITAPIFFAAWYFTMDIVPIAFGKEISSDGRCWVSLLFGLALLVMGLLIDKKKKRDYAFWSYLFGAFSFWGGLTGLVWGKGEGGLFVYLIINLLMMLFSIVLRRNVLMVFGAFGIFAYLGHLAYDLFENSILFPFALSFIGLAVIALGILYQKKKSVFEKKLFEILPEWVRNISD